MAEEGKTMESCGRLQQKYGRHYYGRRDLRLTERSSRVHCGGGARPARIGAFKVQRTEELDGFKSFSTLRLTATAQKPGCSFEAQGQSRFCGFTARLHA